MIDRTALTSAASHARAALAYVELAQAVEVPTIFGRRAANAEIRLSMDLAASASGDALAVLGDDAVLIDSRRAIQKLHHMAAEIRDRGTPVSSRGTAAFTDAIEGVKLHAATMDLVSKLAGTPGYVPPATIHMPTLRGAVGELSGDLWRVPPWLAEASRSRVVDAAAYESLDAAIHLRTADDIAGEVRRLLDPIGDDSGARFDRLAGLGMLPDSMLAKVDTYVQDRLKPINGLLRDDWDGVGRNEVQYSVDRMWVDEIASRPGGAGEELARQLADAAPDMTTARKLGLLLEHDVASLGIAQPARYGLSSLLMDVQSDREAAIMLDALRTVRSGAEPYALGQEARALIAADTLTPEALDRLRVLNALPKAMRPLPPERMLSIFDDLTPAQVEALHDDLRWSVERAGLVRDVEVGSRAVVEEVSGFIARGEEPFSRADVLRLARLQELGRIDGMPRWQSDAWTFREKLNSMKGDTRDLQGEMQRLRGTFERLRVDTDPSITRTTQLTDLRQLLATPNDQLDLAALQRLRSIEEVAGRKGLELPSRLREVPTSTLADAAAGRSVAPELTSELDAMRAWLDEWDIADSSDLQRIANQPAHAALPPHVVEYIGDNWDALIADPKSVAPLTSIFVRRISGIDGRDPSLARTMRMASDLMRSREPASPGALRTLYEGTLETIERNLQRMDGTREDTYNMHPDYAELGRIAASMPLLTHVPASAKPSASASASVGESLTW